MTVKCKKTERLEFGPDFGAEICHELCAGTQVLLSEFVIHYLFEAFPSGTVIHRNLPIISNSELQMENDVCAKTCQWCGSMFLQTEKCDG